MVSILPQKYFVERIGGELVRVSVLVGPGQSPATYEPTPAQMAALSGVDLFYRIGVPFEQVWFDRLLAVNPGIPVLDARQGIELRHLDSGDAHHHGDGERHQARLPDPHVWLSPSRVRVMAAGLRDRLSQLDPANRARYQAGFQAFSNDLARLDQQIRGRLSGLEQRRFMVFHPSWGYFADEYGLQQIAIERAGREPGARSLAKLMRLAEAENIEVIFVQRQFSRHQAAAMAEQLGARVVAIDPLAQGYIDNLLRVADAIAGRRQ